METPSKKREPVFFLNVQRVENRRLTKKNGRMGMSIFIEIEPENFLGHMFNACSTDQVSEFIPEKRGFRIHGHSTTIRLEKVFWTVLEDMSDRMHVTLPQLIMRIHDQCMVANDKNIASCLRVICMKYMNIYA